MDDSTSSCADGPVTAVDPARRRGLGVGLLTALTTSALVALPGLAPAEQASASTTSGWQSPQRPALCTSTQIDRLEIDDCVLIRGAGRPEDLGWGAPPFPEEQSAEDGSTAEFPPAGWTWSGWSYNGSPALERWESRLRSNDTAIGAVRRAQIQAPKDVLPLFEGFLAEIQQGGYRISEAGAYVFRCTSSTRTSCQGLTTRALSFHAWGNAIDINPTRNPQVFLRSSDGVSACARPMTTDIPRWVVRTAERWGLLWGGYGWWTCPTPGTWASSVNRDPHHFEFRGTPEDAQGIAVRNAQTPNAWLPSDERDSTATTTPPSTTPPTTPAPDDTATAERHPLLQLGARGTAVVRAQRALTRHGVRTHDDGIFGPATETNVKVFQRRAGLTVDGVVGSLTWKALEKDPAPPAPVLPTLRTGDRGRAVVALQKALTRAGLRTDPDGIFGPQTARNVTRVQRREGLRQTGVAGTRVWRALGVRSLG